MYNFGSATLNVAPDETTIAGSASASTVISTKTHLLEHVKIDSVSQLINGILKAL